MRAKKLLKSCKYLGLVEKIENYTHSVGYSERGGEMVEPYLIRPMVRPNEAACGACLKVVEDGLIKFYPERWINTYRHWMTNIRDWCISRQLWWGHRIPAWYAETGEMFVGRKRGGSSARKPKQVRIDGPIEMTRSRCARYLVLVVALAIRNIWLAGSYIRSQEFYPTTLLVTVSNIIFFWVAG